MQQDNTFFKMLVEEQYAAQHVHLHSSSPYAFDWRGIYRVEQTNGTNWLLRAFRQDDNTNWLLSHAAVLLFLEQQHYLAPHVVRTYTGELVGSSHGWWTLMLTFVEGVVVGYTPEELQLLGKTAASLHALSPVATATFRPELPASWQQPQQAVPDCLQQLNIVHDHIPAELQTFYESVYTTLERFQRATASFPQILIHGDYWPGNAIQRTTDGDIVLIDWDGAGFGPALLDIGNLLLTSHFGQPSYPKIEPDPSLIAAIVTGYCQQRHLTAPELDILEDAVAFNNAFHFARSIQAMLEGNWREDVGLQKLQIRYEASKPIAHIARTCFEQQSGDQL